MVTMPPTAFAERDLSYAQGAQTRSGRALIRLMENVTGRRSLLRRAQGCDLALACGANIFDLMVARFGLTLEVAGGSLENVPREGPLVMIANHPYGILDGLVMGHVLSRTRGNFRILANSVFARAPQVQRHLLPISFDATKEALALNLETRRHALDYLGQGGAIGVFPGGTVSTGVRPWARPMDPHWRSFTARMVAKSGAVVLPIYFDGHTSRMFQIASHVHSTLRLGLLIQQFRARVDTPVRVVIGKPLGRDILDPMAKDAKATMDFLRKATYELAPEPLKSFEAGYEFEDRHKRR